MRTMRKPFYEFGPYLIDPGRNVLLRGGQIVPLTLKAFETLLILVEHADQEISKDELMKNLWPDTFVEEANLTKHISMVRKALGETAQDHHYILTLPGRGYRFAEKVRMLPEGATELVLESRSLSRVIIEQTEQTDAQPKAVSALAQPRSRAWILLLAVVVVISLIGSFLVLHRRRSISLGDTDWVLVSDFANATGEPIFDGALRQAVTVKLAESPYFNIVLDSTTRQTLQLMGRLPDERVVPPIARDACQREGAKVVVGGSIVSVGNKYVIDLDATNCLSGASLAHAEAEAQNKNEILPRLEGLIQPIRRKLGESVSSIQKFNTPIEEATTSSLAALKAYTAGDEKRAQNKETEAIPLYKMAIDLDPNFAISYARLGAIYADLSERTLADHYMKQAFERRGHVSEREQFYIAAHYYQDSTREDDKAIDTYSLWAQTYPHDWIPFNNLSTEYQKTGDTQKQLESALQALKLNANHGLPYATAVMSYRRAGQYAEAKAVADRAAAAKLDGYIVHFNLYMIAFSESDRSAMQREIDWFKGKPLECLNLNHRAWAAMSLGQLRRGRELFDASRASALPKRDERICGGDGE